MSVYYSRYSINTYANTPYFQAHVPEDYPVNLILQKCRTFRRLPPNLQKLAGLAKQWYKRMYPGNYHHSGIDQFYDEEGYELNAATGKRLTDEEIDKDWEGFDEPDVKVKDIPIPEGGFADPDTWEPPPPEPDEEEEYEGPDKKQLLSDIRGHGREYVAKEYGVPVADSDGALADAILAKVNPKGKTAAKATASAAP